MRTKRTKSLHRQPVAETIKAILESDSGLPLLERVEFGQHYIAMESEYRQVCDVHPSHPLISWS